MRMCPRDSTLHIVIALGWLGVAVWLGIGTALLGNEQTVLAKQRGRDLRARTELAYQVQALRDAIDHASSTPELTKAIRKLGLPLQPPPAVARIE